MWVSPLDGAHHALRLLELSLRNGYFIYYSTVLRIVVDIQWSLPDREHLIVLCGLVRALGDEAG